MVALIVARLEGAHNALPDLEELDQKDIEQIRKNYRKLAAETRREIKKGLADTDCREVAGVTE